MAADATQGGLVVLAGIVVAGIGKMIEWGLKFWKEKREAAEEQAKHGDLYVRATQDGFLALNKVQAEELSRQKSENAELRQRLDKSEAKVQELQNRVSAQAATIEELLEASNRQAETILDLSRRLDLRESGPHDA